MGFLGLSQGYIVGFCEAVSWVKCGFLGAVSWVKCGALWGCLRVQCGALWGCHCGAALGAPLHRSLGDASGSLLR